MPRPKRIETGESIYSHMQRQQQPATPSYATPKITIGEEENKMQQVHHIVRTVSLDNQKHASGAVPMNEVEAGINTNWLAKGWQVLSVGVLRVGQTEFEILYTLVQNVP